MPEITINQIAFGQNGNPANLSNGIELPISNEALDKIMMCMKVQYPYIAHAYSFRLNELNGQIAGPQEVDKLNAFARQLAELSEYERVKLEGTALLTEAKTLEDCTKLLYNLDSFDLTPNVHDYESLGRYFAANDFADSLKGLSPEMMANFDYELLGRMGWDDSTNAFIGDHHIRDTEQQLRNPDPNIDPTVCFMKMRFCSDGNPDGVWIKFPLSGMAAIDSPEQSDEMAVVLKSLGVQSIEECRCVECVSQYPSLELCLEVHGDEPVEQLLWKAHNLGLGESILSQYGKDMYAKFAAILEYEDSGNLDFAADITQNTGCYDFAPTAEGWAVNRLLEWGVEPTLTSCFDLKTLGNTLIEKDGAVITGNGVISRNNKHQFMFEYYQPPELQQQEIRLFCPLEVRTDPDSILGERCGDIVSDFENALIPNSVAQHYTAAINAALENEKGHREQEHGLAEYLDAGLAAKVGYIWPSVEAHNDELWGVFKIKTLPLTEQEMAELTDFCIGQASDGLCEGFEQRPVKTQDGDLYVSFWQSGDDYFMKPEQDFIAEQSSQEYGMEMNL